MFADLIEAACTSTVGALVLADLLEERGQLWDAQAVRLWAQRTPDWILKHDDHPDLVHWDTPTTLVVNGELQVGTLGELSQIRMRVLDGAEAPASTAGWSPPAFVLQRAPKVIRTWLIERNAETFCPPPALDLGDLWNVGPLASITVALLHPGLLLADVRALDVSNADLPPYTLRVELRPWPWIHPDEALGRVVAVLPLCLPAGLKLEGDWIAAPSVADQRPPTRLSWMPGYTPPDDWAPAQRSET
jgi:hypothetical protein